MSDADASVHLDGLAGPEAPSIVAGIGLAVWDALQQAPTHRAALTARDIVLDARGQPRLQPTASGETDRPDDRLQSVAPEIRAGGQPTSEASLWGLGMILHRLATGAPPVFVPGHTGAPPRASTVRPDLPAALDEAIARLLEPTPGQRHTALPLLHEVAGPLPDLSTLMPDRSPSVRARPPSRVGEVIVTTTGGEARSGTVDEAPVRGMLTLPAQEATPTRLSAVAGELAVPVRALRALASTGVDIPVQAGLRGRALNQGADLSDLPLVPTKAPGFALPVLASSAVLAGGGLVVVGLALLVVQTLLAVAVAGAGALVVLGALVPMLMWIGQRSAHRATSSTWRRLQQHKRQLESHALVGGAWQRLARARRHLAQAEHLPETASADVRAGLNELEDQLVALADQDDRLAAADQQASRRAMEDEARMAEEGLDQLDALLLQADVDVSIDVSGALQRVKQAAQLAADSLSLQDPAAPRRVPGRETAR